MQIIHIMKDGTVADSISGTIPNGEFYQVLRGIIEKRSVKHETRKEAYSSATKADRV